MDERARGLDEAASTAVLLRVVRRMDRHLLPVHPEPSRLVLPPSPPPPPSSSSSISRPDCSWSSLVLPRECALRHGHGAQSLTLRKKTTNHSAPRVATTKLHAAIQTPTQIHAITHSATSLQQWEHLGNRIVTRNFFAISRPHTPIS